MKFRDHQIKLKDEAQQALSALLAFIKEVDQELALIQSQVDSFKQKFKRNFSDQFLTHEIREYLEGITLDYSRVQDCLRADQDKLGEKLGKAIEDHAELSEHIRL